MLEPIRHILCRQRNILASTSPRRKEIMNSVNMSFEVMKPSFEENLDKNSFSHPCEYVKENAKQKAISVWNNVKENLSKDPSSRMCDLVIGCDTVVTLDEQIYEKPKTTEDAFRMLSKLSGRTHTVFTGVAILTNINKPSSTSGPSESNNNGDFLVTTFHEASDVTFAELNENVIRAYIATEEPMDKAGGYGVQGVGATLIESIRGDYFNIVGLPIHRLAKELYFMYME